MTCRRRDESSSLLLQVNEPFYDSPQLFPTSQSSFKELIWASPYCSQLCCDWARFSSTGERRWLGDPTRVVPVGVLRAVPAGRPLLRAPLPLEELGRGQAQPHLSGTVDHI